MAVEGGTELREGMSGVETENADHDQKTSKPLTTYLKIA